MPLLSRPVQWCGSCPTHPTAVVASTAVMSRTVPRQVCGVWVCECVSVVFVWWGILCLLPLVVVEGGAIMEGRGVLGVAGGMVREGRQCY